MFPTSIVSLFLAAATAWAWPADHHTHGRMAVAQRATAVSPQEFLANVSQDIIEKLTAAASGGEDSLAEYPVSDASEGTYFNAHIDPNVDRTFSLCAVPVQSTIYGDWLSFEDSPAYYFVADMDVDCDGIDYKCDGNPDGQPKTDWGALSAKNVPWIVIPNSFVSKSDTLPGNNLAAVICGGKMYYGILGDTNGDDPEVTGEASWLLAQTCFPNEGLNGAVGHGAADVTYIVFEAVVPGVGKNYLDSFDDLRSLGDSYISKLINNLGL